MVPTVTSMKPMKAMMQRVLVLMSLQQKQKKKENGSSEGGSEGILQIALKTAGAVAVMNT